VSMPEESDPRDKWTEPTEVTTVAFSGRLDFSCCGKVHTMTGTDRSEVQCPICGTLYGLALLVRLKGEEDYKFPKGTRVRPKVAMQVRAGSSTVTLEPSQIYQAYQDTFGILNVPRGHQPILVSVNGDRGKRFLVANVPEEILEKAD
jgi:hypothetical protein